MFPVTINGKINEPVPTAVADRLLSWLQQCLLEEGMNIYEMDERTVKFKIPFCLWWRLNTSLLYLISNGELRLTQENNALKFTYKVRFHRVIYPFFVMGLVSLLITEHRFDHLLTVLTIGIVALTPLILMSLSTFKSLIVKCIKSCSDCERIG